MKMQIMDLDFAFSNRLITETLSNIHFLSQCPQITQLSSMRF